MLSFLAACVSIVTTVGPHPLAGVWEGKASTGSDATEIFFRFDETGDGAVTSRLDVPLTNIHDAPLGKLVREGDEYAAGESLRLRLDAASGALTGRIPYQGREIRLELKRGTKVPPRPPPHDAAAVAKPAWTFDAQSPIWSSPAIRDGVVFIGASDGRVHALRADTGAPVWEFRTGGAVFARPTVSRDHVFVPSDDGKLYKLDAASGREVWRAAIQNGAFERDLPRNGEGAYDYLASAATVHAGIVYVGSADGRLCAIDEETGEAGWDFQTKAPVRSTAAVADGLVVFGSRDRFVYALDAQTGDLKWKHDTGDVVVSSPAIDAQTVYIGSRSADLFAFELASGRVLWRFFYWFSWVESSGTVRDGVVYVGSSDAQRLHAIDARRGSSVWTFDTDGSAWSSPAVTDGTVYIGTVGTVGYMADHRGGFFAVDRKSGRERWRLPMAEIAGQFAYGVASSPAVAHGRVYFGGLDGKVYACADE